MKKYLTIICALLTLMAFASCGDSNSTSDSSEVPESNISETITETTTEVTTEPETKEKNPFLDEKITCDYLSFYAPSEWNPEINTYDDGASIFCEWEEESESYNILFFVNETIENENYMDYSNREILNQFTSHGQEYTITKSGTEKSNLVFFFNDKVNGSMSYPITYENIVMDMIDSIEFNYNTSEISDGDVSKNSVELDSDWECDYLKISTCSDWEEDSQINGKSFTEIWNWEDSDVYHFISLTLDESSMGKMSQSDLQEFYEEYFKYSSNENNYKIIDNFMEDKQAYVVIGNEELPLWNIHFSTDTVQGDFTYTSKDEEIVRNMIKTIEFY